MSDRTPEISLDELAAAVRQGATVVAVREPGEYVGGHVPGAVYVVCASGNRSASTTDFLTYADLNAYSVAGGTSGWARSGRDVVTGAAPTA